MDARSRVSISSIKEIFLFSKLWKQVLRSIQSAVQLVTEVLYQGIKQSGCENDYSFTQCRG
jgi:hypothetical protein